MAGRAFTIAVALVATLSGCAAVDGPTQGARLPPPPLPAADGTDLDACRDAACEVEVRVDDEVRLDPGWRVDAMKVEYLSKEKLTLWLTGLSGPGSLEGFGTDLVGNDGRVTITWGRSGRVNDVAISMVPGDPDRAVLTLRPA